MSSKIVAVLKPSVAVAIDIDRNAVLKHTFVKA